MAEEIRVRLGEAGRAVSDSEPSAAEETLWSFWYQPAERPTDYLIWCEPAIDAHWNFVGDVRWRSPEQQTLARSTRWLVGLEGPLSPKQPTIDYQLQLRLCDEISRGWAPVVGDANSLVYRAIEDVRSLASANVPPRTSSLYSIHKLVDREVDGELRYWVHTHGLERAGIPDLEMFDVPKSRLGAAKELIESVADLWIEFGTPEPEEEFLIGRAMNLRWRPWHDVAASMAPRATGGWRLRQDDPSHAGNRAVLVDATGEAGGIRAAGAPLEVLTKLVSTGAILFKSTQETDRTARLAYEQWGTFGLLFASKHPEDWRFAVKLSYDQVEEGGGTEHLWFEVKQLRPGGIRAELVSTPKSVEGMARGDVDWHSLDRLSDWRIVTPSRVYDPETASILLESSSV
ncbi:hypothetical protein Pan216_31820 [Planctomycetes bacterium Pan216]|uniref:Uncharacterized protein n=2 Tax=Kolteria novifilia TaxID=2527975 RepID=A0A518B5R2_9BACT|nr:hypothetical protein Pan216_31820 [Planctomycetes bacterium Pan216]